MVAELQSADDVQDLSGIRVRRRGWGSTGRGPRTPRGHPSRPRSSVAAPRHLIVRVAHAPVLASGALIVRRARDIADLAHTTIHIETNLALRTLITVWAPPSNTICWVAGVRAVRLVAGPPTVVILAVVGAAVASLGADFTRRWRIDAVEPVRAFAPHCASSSRFD